MADIGKHEPRPAYEAARSFVRRGPQALLIDGRWGPSSSGETFDVVDPSSGEILCQAAEASVADVDLAVAAAQRALEGGWRTLAPYDRTNLLLRIADILERNSEELGVIQAHDMGMLVEQAIRMAAGTANVFRYYAGWVTKIYGQTLPSRGPGLSYTLREPVGVVGAIIPWNGPSQATAWKLAPALACGNTVVFKPAEEAPLVSLRMAELLQEAGLPDGVVNVVTGDGETVGSAMVEHPGIHKITFTGSTRVGQDIIARGARTMKKVTAELGGKSPTVIFPDADMDKAARSAVTAFSAAAGQACVAGSRILVHRSVYDEVAARISLLAGKLKVGGAFDQGVDVPPVVSQKQLDGILGYVAAGQEEGARLAVGGKRLGDAGFYVEPTVFADTRPGMRIVEEEIFGPVGAVMPFDDMAQAVTLSNDNRYGLAATIWTKDIATAQTFVASVQAGMVWVNTFFELDLMAPFGGYKLSGQGRELGSESIDAYTQTKTVVMRF